MPKTKAFIEKQQIKLIQNRLTSIKIEGTIASLKEFISAREVFFNKDLYTGMENFQNKKLVILDKYDVSAIGVFDLMHNDENGPYFDDLDSQDFADVVTDILNGDNFEISIKTVKTINDNTTLRLKHANSDFSANFKDAIVGNQQPVVLAHGIHSDLFTWNGFATDLATDPENAKDAWLIEMYGGPTTECSNCPVYTFNDLRSYYWPSLIAGVQHYSGQNNLSYVGYDLGCTVALESLENYSSGANNIGYYFDTTTGDYNYAEPMDLSSNPIDTFVAVACVGNFTPIFINGSDRILPSFSDYIKNHPGTYQEGYFYYDFVVYPLYGDHLSGGFYLTNEFAKTVLIPIPPLPWYLSAIFSRLIGEFDVVWPKSDSSSISFGVYRDMLDWINSSEPNPGENVALNNFAIIQSTYDEDDTSKGFIIYRKNSDYVVSDKDQLEICKNVNSNNKYYVSFKNLPHFGSVLDPSISKRGKVKNVIKEFLNGQTVKQNKNFEIISTNSNCE